MKEQKITGRERTLRTPSPGIVVANVKWIPSDNCQGSIEVFSKSSRLSKDMIAPLPCRCNNPSSHWSYMRNNECRSSEWHDDPKNTVLFTCLKFQFLSVACRFIMISISIWNFKSSGFMASCHQVHLLWPCAPRPNFGLSKGSHPY